MGIIDILQTYGCRKSAENTAKRAVQAAASSAQCRAYRQADMQRASFDISTSTRISLRGFALVAVAAAAAARLGHSDHHPLFRHPHHARASTKVPWPFRARAEQKEKSSQMRAMRAARTAKRIFIPELCRGGKSCVRPHQRGVQL